MCGGDKIKKVKTLHYTPKSPPSSQAAKSHAGKAEAITHEEKKKKNEKKNLTVSHTQHRALPILTSLPQGRNGEMGMIE